MTSPTGETERIAAGLITRTLPKPEWTHEAHLRAGLWHLLRYAPAQSLDLLRERIRAYNEATGVANTATSGYHETLTVFYVRIIDAFLAAADRTAPADQLALQLVAAWGGRELPLGYYSRTRLFSEEARRTWVEPDIQPLPGAP